MMIGATAISRQTELVAAACLRLRELDSADNCALATTPIDKLPPRWEPDARAHEVALHIFPEPT